MNLRIRHPSLLLLSLSNLFAPISKAQDPGVPEIRVESNEVIVPVFVMDRTHARWQVDSTGEERLVEVDQEITGLTAKDFHLFQDGAEQHVQNVTVERDPWWIIADNVSQHDEFSCTPSGVWACADEVAATGQSHLHTYFVAYVPPPSPEGACHHIKIQVNHKPKASVYARDEYCNVQHLASDPLLGTKIGNQMEKFATSPQNSRIPLSARANIFWDRVDLTVEFPWKSLEHELVGCFQRTNVSILGLVYGKGGTLAARFSDIACQSSRRFIDNNPTCEMGSLEFGVLPTRYLTQLHLPVGDYSLKLVVTDGEQFGRIEIPVTVPQYDPQHLAIADLAVSKRFRKVAADESALAPQYVRMISKGVQFMATADTRFLKSDRLLAYTEIYEPLLTAIAPVKVEFQMRIKDEKTGAIKTDTGLRPADSFVQEGKQVVPIAEEVAIAELPPGSYTLQIQASDSAGNKTEWREAAFTVE